MQLLRRVLALRKRDAPSEGNTQEGQLADSISSDPSVESVQGVANENVNGDASSLSPDGQGEMQIQAGCTALVAIFKVMTY